MADSAEDVRPVRRVVVALGVAVAAVVPLLVISWLVASLLFLIVFAL